MTIRAAEAVFVLTAGCRLHAIGKAWNAWLVSVEFFPLARTVLCIDIQRLLEALIGLIMIAEQVLQLLLLHLLLMGNWL